MQIESRAEVLFIMHICMVGYGDHIYPLVTAINVPVDAVGVF
jgi:hypothetical protein